MERYIEHLEHRRNLLATSCSYGGTAVDCFRRQYLNKSTLVRGRRGRQDADRREARSESHRESGDLKQAQDDLIWVDRIDTSRIRICPHDVVLTVKERLGVPIFYHPDGKPCSVLNKLDLTGDEINAEDVRLNKAIREAKSIFEKIDDPWVCSRMSTYKPLVKRLAQELENERDLKKLEHMFLAIMRCTGAIEIFMAIGTVLGPEKNRILLNNVAAIYTEHYMNENLEYLYPLLVETEPVLERNLRRKGP